jgi:hypothetical protein
MRRRNSMETLICPCDVVRKLRHQTRHITHGCYLLIDGVNQNKDARQTTGKFLASLYIEETKIFLCWFRAVKSFNVWDSHASGFYVRSLKDKKDQLGRSNKRLVARRSDNG